MSPSEPPLGALVDTVIFASIDARLEAAPASDAAEAAAAISDLEVSSATLSVAVSRPLIMPEAWV
jgi:hypothetical protein